MVRNPSPNEFLEPKTSQECWGGSTPLQTTILAPPGHTLSLLHCEVWKSVHQASQKALRPTQNWIWHGCLSLADTIQIVQHVFCHGRGLKVQWWEALAAWLLLPIQQLIQSAGTNKLTWDLYVNNHWCSKQNLKTPRGTQQIQSCILFIFVLIGGYDPS